MFGLYQASGLREDLHKLSDLPTEVKERSVASSDDTAGAAVFLNILGSCPNPNVHVVVAQAHFFFSW